MNSVKFLVKKVFQVFNFGFCFPKDSCHYNTSGFNSHSSPGADLRVLAQSLTHLKNNYGSSDMIPV